MVCRPSQSGLSAHCDPVQRACFIKGLVVINERVELSMVLKVSWMNDGLTLSTVYSSQQHVSSSCSKTICDLF